MPPTTVYKRREKHLERDGIEFKTSNYPSNHLNHLTVGPRVAYTRNVFEFPPRKDSEKNFLNKQIELRILFCLDLKFFFQNLIQSLRYLTPSGN